MVHGPVVVLDLDAGSLATLCGEAARKAAREWSDALADPAEKRVICTWGAVYTPCGISCAIGFMPGETNIEVEIEDTEPPRLHTVRRGLVEAGGRFGLFVRAYKAQLARAACADE